MYFNVFFKEFPLGDENININFAMVDSMFSALMDFFKINKKVSSNR